MAHVNRVKCVEISEEKISESFDKVHVNIVNNAFSLSKQRCGKIQKIGWVNIGVAK